MHNLLAKGHRLLFLHSPLPTLATRPHGRTAMAPAFAKASEGRRGRFGALLPYRTHPLLSVSYWRISPELPSVERSRAPQNPDDPPARIPFSLPDAQ